MRGLAFMSESAFSLRWSASTRFPGEQASFGAGAMTGSFLFFFALGYGATALRPIFASPASWRALEALVALTMWTIAFKLIVGL
jgi:L-lysine exporter family protein LysE/ArgO